MTTAERDTGLVVRIWWEPADPGRVRARLLSFDRDDEPVSWSTAAGESELLAELERWVRLCVRQRLDGA